VGDGKGAIFVGLNGGGLLRFGEGRWTRMRQRDGLAEESVWALFVDATDGLWIGSPGSGLTYLKEGRAFVFADPALRLPRVITSMVEDDLGYLWMGSNKGIHRVLRADLEEVARGARKSIEVFSYSKSDGMESTECTGGLHPAAIKGRDGRIWFATVNGLSVIDPARLPVNRLAPPVVVEEVLIDDRLATNAVAGGALSIPPGAHRLEIHYTGVSLTAGEKVKFKYRLEGVEGDWVDAQTRRVAYYTGLTPGPYRFKVIACNNDGFWNATGAELAVEALPFFWQTMSFRIGASLAGALLLAGAVRYVSVKKLQRRVERLEQEQAVEIERSRIARDMHDDVGATLTQISLLGELARGELKADDRVQSRLVEISALSREVVSHFDELVWAANPKHDATGSAIEYLCQYAMDFLSGSGIRCRLDLPDELPNAPLAASTRHHLFLVMKEALNNAMKHAGATEIRLRVVEEDSTLVIFIEDNGRGFEVGRKNAFGNGVANMRSRMESFGGSLEVSSKMGVGTTVRLVTPMARS